MLTKNSWFNTTLPDRLLDKAAAFKLVLTPYQFKEMDFNSAADYTCMEIYAKYKNLYLALSGGLDSEFILRCCYRNNVPVKPIIVKCGNDKEMRFALDACSELNITPIVLELSEQQLLEYFKENVFDKFAGVGYNSTHNLIAADYVSKIDNAYLLSGNHLISDDNKWISDIEYCFAYEWDFYTDYFINPCININFYIYTVELVYATAPKATTTWSEYKHSLFNLSPRDKIRHSYSDNTMATLMGLLKSTHKYKKNVGEVWTKQQFYEFFDNYKGA